MDTRRTFLKTAAAAGTFLNLNPAAIGANDKVTLALIDQKMYESKKAGKNQVVAVTS